MREMEVKAVVPDEGMVRARLAAAGARPVFEGTLLDRRYDTPARTLTARDAVLRLRVQRAAAGDANARATIEFKGAASIVEGYKVREETGSVVDDAEALDAILKSLGYEITREVEREVAVFTVAGATVRLERYPRMDVLVEVEGDAPQIERAIAVLALPRRAFTADALVTFVRRFEERTGQRAAICRRELAGDYRFRVDDA